LPHIAHHLQHEVPVPQPDKNLGQPAIGLQQNGPTGAGAKVSLELTPIDSVTLSDGYYPGERAQCRRYALERSLRSGPLEARRWG
jgi:hypothetical protein